MLEKLLTKMKAEIRAKKTRNNTNHENGTVYFFELNDKQDICDFIEFNTARIINHSCNCGSKN